MSTHSINSVAVYGATVRQLQIQNNSLVTITENDSLDTCFFLFFSVVFGVYLSIVY